MTSERGEAGRVAALVWLGAVLCLLIEFVLVRLGVRLWWLQ